MAATDSFINLRSTGTSGALTHYADGKFLSVWTDFDKSGGAYVYGKVFNADGTAAGNHFLIDYTASALYREVTVETLSGGRTVVAWVKSDGSGTSVVGKVLSTSFVLSGDLLELSPFVDSEEAPQLHALDSGGFTMFYRGSATIEGETYTGLIAHSLIPDGAGWSTDYHVTIDGFANDGSNATTALRNGTRVAAAAVGAVGGGGVNVGVLILRENGEWDPYAIDDVPGATGGINPAITAIGPDRVVVVWEDVEGQGRVIRAQVVDTTGTKVGNPITLTKPPGSLKGTPVIKAFARSCGRI